MQHDSYKDIDMYQGVCFTCQTHSKHGELCPRCRQPFVVLGKRAKIPKKGDASGWAHLALVYPAAWARHLKNKS